MAGMDELMRSLEGSRDDQTKTEPEIPKEIVGLLNSHHNSMDTVSTGMLLMLSQYGVLAAHIKVIQLVASENADGMRVQVIFV